MPYSSKRRCDIVSADINLDGAKQTKAAVKALRRNVISLKVDVRNNSEVDEMVKIALKELGKIDIFTNTAGLTAMLWVPFLESKQEM